MNVKQLTALLAALTVLQGVQAQTTISTQPITITGSTVTVSGSPSLTTTFQEAQQFQGPDGRLYPAAAYWSAVRPPSPPGQLNCVNCGTTDANYVGAYALNMTCPNPDNQYWASWGGTCWACPGPVRIGDLFSYKLTGDPTSGGSCFKRLNPWLYTGSKMTKGGVNSGVMSWDCGSGEFWQMYDNKGNWTWWGGACYSCPAGYGWNGRGPTSGTDCVKPDDYAQPRLANFNGCPEPDAAAMGLTGQRKPDKPFLDIAAGWSQGVIGGGCYACPAVLEDGSIVVSERNINSLIGKPTGNKGCDVKVSYKPRPFPEPGLMGINGVRDLVTENLLFSAPEALTASLHTLAEGLGYAPDSAAARQLVKTKWEQIAQNPAASPEFQAAIFNLIRDAAFKPNPTESEKAVLAAFAEYVRQRKIYLADIALNMYDTWKPVNDQQMAARRPAGSVTNLFYYGNVPFDFSKVVEGSLGFGLFTATSLATAASFATMMGNYGRVRTAVMNQFFADPAYSKFYDINTLVKVLKGRGVNMEEAQKVMFALEKQIKVAFRAQSMPKVYQFNGNFIRGLTNLRGFVGNVGPMLVMMAASILVQMAIEQAIAIETARPKLLAAKEAAAAPVNLKAMFTDAGGDDMLFILWRKAMEGPAYADPAMVAAAVAANNAEAARAYAKAF